MKKILIGQNIMKKKKANKNSLIYRWTNDKNPVRVGGKSSKNIIEIKHVTDIEEVLSEKETQPNEQKN